MLLTCTIAAAARGGFKSEWRSICTRALRARLRNLVTRKIDELVNISNETGRAMAMISEASSSDVTLDQEGAKRVVARIGWLKKILAAAYGQIPAGAIQAASATAGSSSKFRSRSIAEIAVTTWLPT